MRNQEWSRSQFWLCHFLNSRHARVPVSWDQPRPASESPEVVTDFLRRRRIQGAEDGRRLIEMTLANCSNDPAYVQSMRLLVKEGFHLEHLTQRLLKRLPDTHSAGSQGVVSRL